MKNILFTGLIYLALVSQSSQAVDKNWACDNDSWDNPACWNPTGQPLHGDDAYLTQTDAVDRTVTYSNSIFPVLELNSLMINATGSGTMTLSQNQDSLAAATEYIGYDGTGTFTHTGGDNIVNDLYLGYLEAGNGTYNLGGSGSLIADTEVISRIGNGTFNQTGGSNTANYIAVAKLDVYTPSGYGTQGTYNLSGGSLSVGNMDITEGYEGGGLNGVFNQSGGSVLVSNRLDLTSDKGARGTYNLSAGSLEADVLTSSNFLSTGAEGVFNQTGGTAIINRIVAPEPEFTYNLAAGSLSTNTIELTAYSNFNQTGGVNTVSDTLMLNPGRNAAHRVGGDYLLTDGTLNTGNIEVVGSTFTQTGGNNTVTDNLSISTNVFGVILYSEYTIAGGSLDATNITVENGNSFNFNGGTLAVDNFTGNLVNNGGTLAAGDSPGTTHINGDYTQLIAGIFGVEIGGLLQGSEYDWLNITGNATLGGTLDVDLFDLGSGSFTLGVGDVFDILSAESITGEFDLLTLAALGEGLEWDVSYLTDFSGTTDLVRLTVNDVNVMPIANAGNDQIVNESADVNLNGNLSDDSDGSIASYSWTQTAGTSVTINDANTATPSFTAPSVISDTLLMFSLVVTDNNGDTDTASVTITVSNVLVVDAGTDQQITEGDIVQLNGLNSLDVSDIIVSYLWLQTEGPAVNLDDSSSATPSFIAPAVDITTLLVFKLIVSDSNGLQDYDTTFVNVRDELLTDIAPPLDVQLIDTVVSGNVLYQFDTMSDPFFASANVQWSQVNGPAVTLDDADTAIPSFMTPAVSVDSATTFEVRSTNIDGLIVRANVNVNIPGPASANLAPTANAGNGQVVTEGDTVNLDATASTDDGSIVSYYWQQTGGPMVMLTSIIQAQPSFVVPAIAAVDDSTTLSFEVVVTDDGGFMARQSVTITILDNGISDFADSSDGEGGSMNPLLLVFLLLGFIARTYARLHYRDQTPFSHD